MGVTRNEWTFRDDSERESLAACQMLEHRARDAKPPLRRLVRIGRRTDDDGLAERNVFEIGGERGPNLFLYKDAPLQCLPPLLAALVGKLGVGQLAGLMRALDDVAVCVA